MSQLKYWNGTAWAPVIVGAQGPTGATGATGPAGTATVYRWTKTVSGGETSLSGNDSNGIALQYTVGQELLHINGILQVRGTDYVASTGSTITGLAALSAGDIVDIWSPGGFSVGDSYTQAVANATFPLNTSSFFAGKNKIINGDFGVWQRGTSFASSGVYSADRWLTDNATTSRQSAGLSGFTYCLQVANAAANPAIRQGIELPATGVAGQFYVGSTWTISFWCKVSVATSYRLNIFAGFNDGVNSGTNMVQITNYDLGAPTTTWTRYSYTFTIGVSPNGTNTALMVVPYLNSIGAYAGNWQITGIQLEAGSVATAFIPAGGGSPQAELSLCQRYFQTLPTATLIQGYNSSAAIFWWQPKVDMRSTPSVTLSTSSPYWESVPYTTVGSLTSASLNATKLTPTGGTLVIAGTYSPTPVANYPTLLNGSVLTFSSEL